MTRPEIFFTTLVRASNSPIIIEIKKNTKGKSIGQASSGIINNLLKKICLIFYLKF